MIKSKEDAERLRDFASLLGWRELSVLELVIREEPSYVLHGMPPCASWYEDVPEFYTDWAAVSNLMFQYKVSIDFQPEQGYVAAGIVGKLKYATFYDEQTDDHIRTAACRSVICAVRQHLRTLEYAARQSDAHQNEKGRP